MVIETTIMVSKEKGGGEDEKKRDSATGLNLFSLLMIRFTNYR